MMPTWIASATVRETGIVITAASAKAAAQSLRDRGMADVRILVPWKRPIVIKGPRHVQLLDVQPAHVPLPFTGCANRTIPASECEVAMVGSFVAEFRGIWGKIRKVADRFILESLPPPLDDGLIPFHFESQQRALDYLEDRFRRCVVKHPKKARKRS